MIAETQTIKTFVRSTKSTYGQAKDWCNFKWQKFYNSNAYLPIATLVVSFAVIGPVSFLTYKCSKKASLEKATETEIQNKIDAYVATLPNWNDSIRFAKTDKQLQNALNHREQNQLKIAHFTDSVRAMGK